jgi:hypothetical protein
MNGADHLYATVVFTCTNVDFGAFIFWGQCGRDSVRTHFIDMVLLHI